MPRHGTPNRMVKASSPRTEDITEPSKLNIDILTNLIKMQLEIGDTKSALFWAEKRMAVQCFNNSGKPKLYEIAQYLKILRSAGDWKSLCTYIVTRDLHFRHLVFSYFYVAALHQLQNYEDIVNLPLGHLRKWDNVPMIIPDTVAMVFAERSCQITEEDIVKLDQMLNTDQLESRLLFLLADTYLTLQNRTAASACILYSIKLNPLSSEAITFALKSHLIPVLTIRELLQNSCESFKGEDKALIDVIYLLLEYHNPDYQETVPTLKFLEKSLSTDLSIQTAKALRLYSSGHISDAFEITDQAINKYGYEESCLLIHIGCLVELKKMVQLYELSHKLIEMEPDQELTYYALGCYYYVAEQYQMARKFFHKSVTLNPNFGHGWLAHGHALSLDKEHEQAMNCYLRAARLLENFAEPHLYTGIEYCHANNLKQAEEYIQKAEVFCKTSNPIILHELGTVYLYDKAYDHAIHMYFQALMALTNFNTTHPYRDIEELLGPIFDNFWGPLYFNLGYAMLKANRHCTAITCFRKVLQMGYQKANAWGQIGFCYLAAGRPRLAVNAFTQSVALNPNITSVKHAYERAIAILSKLPILTIDNQNVDSIESVENLPPHKNESWDNRPNLGTFLMDIKHANKLNPDQVFREYRGIKDPPLPKPTQVIGSRRRGAGPSNDERPNTAPAAISHGDEPEWSLRGSVLIEESMADIEAFEGHPRIRDRDTASAEAVMTSDPDRSTADEVDLGSDNFSSDEMNSSMHRSRRSLLQSIEVRDPQELFTEWFMHDIHHDGISRVEEVSTLRPPPVPRRRDSTSQTRSSDLASFRGSVLRNRIRGGRRQRT